VGERSDDVRKRLQVLMDLWLKIISLWESGERPSREEVVEMLREAYEKAGLEPLRGASTPPDLFDKEMASLYVVGKYGMGLDRQYPEIFDSIFNKEVKYEEALSAILKRSDVRDEDLENLLKAILGSFTDNDVARMLRIKLTQVYFGFADEEELVRILKTIYEKLPNKRKLAIKYIRFFIAFKVASAIARGRVRNKIVKEIVKQASALSFSNIHGVLPDDSYIATIARGVFGVGDRVIRTTLSPEKSGSRGAREAETTGNQAIDRGRR
jgi:hypothetical protein